MAKKPERRITCLIHIPGRYPDGRDVEPEKMARFLEILDRQFGGSSPLGVIPGRWLCEDKTIEEPMHRIEVAVKENDLKAFEKVARLIGRETKQQLMYVVINYQAEARFLFVDDQDESPQSEEDSPPQAASQ